MHAKIQRVEDESEWEDAKTIVVLRREAEEPRVDERVWQKVRKAPLFQGMPDDPLQSAIESGGVSIVQVGRDELLPMNGRVALIIAGQVALARFAAPKLTAERAAIVDWQERGPKPDKLELLRRQERGPMIRIAERNLARFEDGDVLEMTAAAAAHATIAAYAVTPVVVALLERSTVAEWKERYSFMADRLRRAGTSARARVEAEGATAEVTDFFLRHGLSVSLTLRVRRLDACFECGACEKACEERYGVKRLSLNGRLLGGLDFVDACHTCFDQRCIDPCNYDAISFDAKRSEVVINEAACTGCSMCALACPYDAIEMHVLDTKPLLKLRLEKAKALEFGDGTPRKARLRQIASKCDHCVNYSDQACISACPTGALLEVAPEDVESELTRRMRDNAKAGFDQSIAVKLTDSAAVKPFVQGIDLPEFGRARARRTQITINFWWIIGWAAFAVSFGEILLRLFAPGLSLSYLFQTRIDGIDPDVALLHISYHPGCPLAMYYGYVGTALMGSTFLYVLRRRVPFLSKVGSLQGWFAWHVMSGVIGPMFVLLHTAAKLDNWISLSVWSMIGAVLSGLLGRYLSTQLPVLFETARVELFDTTRALVKWRKQEPALVRAAEEWLAAMRRRIGVLTNRVHKGDEKATIGRGVVVLLWLWKDDLARATRARGLWSFLRDANDPAARREIAQLADKSYRLERRKTLMPELIPLFGLWKAFHVPMAIVLSVIGTIHIVLAMRGTL